MEALKFLKEAQRLCEQSKYCSAVCPLYEKCIFDFMYENESSKETWERIEKAAATIEQWSKEHPIATNAQKFKEVFGEKRWSDLVDCKIRNASGEEIIAELQKTDWWDEPYKEPEHE